MARALAPIASLAPLWLLGLVACVVPSPAPPLPDEVGIAGRDAVRAPHASASSVLLDVPHIRQEHDLCVPTAAAMVTAFFGDPRSPRELKVRSRRRPWDPDAPFDDFTATWWKDLIAGVESLGYAWREVVFPDDRAGFLAGLARVQESLRAGRPVLLDVALYGSHTFVAVGFDQEERTLIIRDPNLPAPGFRVLTFDQLASIWNGRSYGLDARPALFTRPASSAAATPRRTPSASRSR